MAVRTTRGWAFRSPLSLPEMKQRLDAAWATPWIVGDSEHLGDHLGGTLTPEGVARVYAVRDGFVVNLRFVSLSGDVVAQLQAAEQRLLHEVLPLVEAQDVVATEPLE